jgi:AAA15 family ATPase/GTPase
MLLRFGVSNFRSINERQELSMIADRSIKDRDEGVIEVDNPSLKERVLPAALIYGANASGKTSLVQAFEAMTYFVLRSNITSGFNRRVYEPFLLDDTTSGNPCSFDVDFLAEDVRYHYGFSINRNEVTEEYLYSFPQGKKRKLYQRDIKSKETDFGDSLRGKLKEIEGFTRPDALFLSTAFQNNHPLLTILRRWFLQSETINATAKILRVAEHSFDPAIISFLKDIGTGIVDYRFIEDRNRLSIRNTNNQLNLDILDDESKFERKIEKIQFGHKTSKGDIVFFNVEKESTGTRRVIFLLQKSLKALETGTPFFIDELDASLHTKLAEKLIQLFQNKATNPKGAQLIATTHDTNLMSSAHLRRDQIWFTEKNPEQATQLYPLTDFNTRKEGNIEKGYLDGRYGAIPYGGSIAALFSK